MSKVANPPEPPPGATKPPPTHHSLLTTQLAQMRRRMPDTSESSSQESSSDTDDVTLAAAGSGATAASSPDVRPRVPSRNAPLVVASRHCSEQRAHACRKCGNHWDVCVCTEGACNELPTQPSNGIETGGGASTSAAASSAGAHNGRGGATAAAANGRLQTRSTRGMPSIRPNASKNRQRQLDAMRKYEEKFKREAHALQQLQQGAELREQAGHVMMTNGMNASRKVAQHPMYVHVLDISRVLERGVVSWQGVQACSCIDAPEETNFYSLVEGRGELIMFGGILDHDSMKTMQRSHSTAHQTVSNSVHFLRPPPSALL